MAYSLGGISVRNTSTLIGPDLRLCVMIQAPPKRGKTTMAGSLNRLTEKHMGKPSLYIATESADGGGTMSVQDLGIDYVQPESLEQFQKLISALAGDSHYGGVIVDSSSDLIHRFIKPMALKLPTRGTPPASRAKGVPCWDDYQVMGEYGRIEFNNLINLTTHKDLNIRKHLIVTALEKELSDDEGNLKAIKTDLPGQLKDSITAMFQTVGRLMIRTNIIPDPNDPKRKLRQQRYVFVTKNDGIADIGDRTKVFPSEAPPDVCEVWESHFIPRWETKVSMEVLV